MIKQRKEYCFRLELISLVGVGGILLLSGCNKYSHHFEESRAYWNSIETIDNYAASAVANIVDPFVSIRGVNYLIGKFESRDNDAQVSVLCISVIYESLPNIRIDNENRNRIENLISESAFQDMETHFINNGSKQVIRDLLRKSQLRRVEQR